MFVTRRFVVWRIEVKEGLLPIIPFQEILPGKIFYAHCGQLYTCKCFENFYDFDEDVLRHRLSLGGYKKGEDLINDVVLGLKVKSSICHYCTKQTPNLSYAGINYSTFRQIYDPYYQLLSKKEFGSTFPLFGKEKEIENKTREMFDYPEIGEKWLDETFLFKICESLLSPKYEIFHHYRGKELEGLELDIWIPDIKVGIEYQGEQHYKVVKHWGGEKGLLERKLQDKKKKEICKKLGYRLIEFKFSEKLTTEIVEKKIKKISES